MGADPLSAGIFLAGATLKSIKSYNKANARKKTLAYDSKRLREQRDVVDTDYREEIKKRDTNAINLAGKQRATSAAQGFLVDSGSNMDIIEDTYLLNKLDADNLRRNASSKERAIDNKIEQVGDAYGNIHPMFDALTSFTGSYASKWYNKNNKDKNKDKEWVFV